MFNKEGHDHAGRNSREFNCLACGAAPRVECWKLPRVDREIIRRSNEYNELWCDEETRTYDVLDRLRNLRAEIEELRLVEEIDRLLNVGLVGEARVALTKSRLVILRGLCLIPQLD